MAGSDTSEPPRALNPAFVEALMGWPTGSSDRGSQSLVKNLIHAGFRVVSVVSSEEPPTL